jgi:hypothetical protein
MGENYEALSKEQKLKVDEAVRRDVERSKRSIAHRAAYGGTSRDYEEQCREVWASPEGLAKLDEYLKSFTRQGRG